MIGPDIETPTTPTTINATVLAEPPTAVRGPAAGDAADAVDRVGGIDGVGGVDGGPVTLPSHHRLWHASTRG
ncbi:MAG TPA: hypothetical protein VH419_15765 [Nocardioidaceae bacterium]